MKKAGAPASKPALSVNIGHEIATNPFLDWIIILSIGFAVALILVGVGVSVYLDTQAKLESPVSASNDRPALPLDQAALTKVLSDFAARAQTRSSILSRWSPPPDPSLP